jgi:FOG: WD40 repeat
MINKKSILLISFFALCGLQAMHQPSSLKEIAFKKILANPLVYNDAINRVPVELHDELRTYWAQHNNGLMTEIMHTTPVMLMRLPFTAWCKAWVNKLLGDDSIIRSAKLNHHENKIVIASSDKTAKITDLYGKCLVTLQGHGHWVCDAEFNNKGDVIATASYDKTAKLWDMQGNCHVTLNGHNDVVRSVAFNSIGDKILTASQDATARLWQIDGRHLVTFCGHKGVVSAAGFNSAADKVITASYDKTVKMWDLQGNCLVTFQGHSGWVTTAQWNKSSDKVVTASVDKTAKIWNNQGICLVTLRGHTDVVWYAEFNDAGDKIVTASKDTTAKIWDLSGNCLSTIRCVDNVWSASFNTVGDTVITATHTRDIHPVKKWNISSINKVERYLDACMPVRHLLLLALIDNAKRHNNPVMLTRKEQDILHLLSASFPGIVKATAAYIQMALCWALLCLATVSITHTQGLIVFSKIDLKQTA